MRNTVLISLVISTLILASGCGNRMWEDSKDAAANTYDYVFDDAPTAKSYHETESIPIIELNYRAADVLYANVGKGELTEHSAVFVKRFINRDDRGDKSIFGQVMTQQVADRLVQHGVLITEGTPNSTDFAYAEGAKKEDYMNIVRPGSLPEIGQAHRGLCRWRQLHLPFSQSDQIGGLRGRICPQLDRPHQRQHQRNAAATPCGKRHGAIGQNHLRINTKPKTSTRLTRTQDAQKGQDQRT